MKTKTFALIVVLSLLVLQVMSACVGTDDPISKPVVQDAAAQDADPQGIEQETDSLPVTPGESESTPTSQKDDLWKSIYSEVIRRGTWEYHGDTVGAWFGVYYTIHDIDQNGVPELILGPRHGGNYLPIILYTIIDDELVVLDDDLDCNFGNIYNPSPGIIELIEVSGAGSYNVYLEHLQIEDGEVVDKYVRIWKRSSFETDYTADDGTIISEEELWETIIPANELTLIAIEADDLSTWSLPQV